MGLFKKKKRFADHDRIVIGENAKGSVVEGYNRLKDNILYMNADGNTKVIQIESAGAKEGKTTVACNLAVSLGLTDKKVLMIDLDFRRPKLHRVFDLSNEQGVAEYILGKSTIEEIIKTTQYKNVDIITRGAEIFNSSLVLVSEKFKEFIKTLRNEYDYIILDCAPVLNVSDYIHITKVSDGVIFLIAYGSTTKAQVAEAIKELRKNDAKILGTVFSMYESKYGNYNYYYY
jgi:capsular exopolysaccharide synthesis family protein